MTDHALSCPNCGLFLSRHDDSAKEKCALGAQDITPIAVSYKHQINSRTVPGERTGVGALREGDTDKGVTKIYTKAQGGGITGWTRNRASDLRRMPGQEA